MKMRVHTYLHSGPCHHSHPQKRQPSFFSLKTFKIYALAVFVLWSAPACVKPIALVSRGQSNFLIYHTSNAPQSVQEAAQELQHYIEKVSGAHLPITTDPPGQNFISIGDSSPFKNLDIAIKDIPPEGYKIFTRNGSLFIVGNDTPDNTVTGTGGNSTGTLYGAYAFIEQYLGVRWFMPGEVGEYVPRQDSISIPAVDISGAPDFQRRELAYIQNHHPKVEQWCRRNRLGGALRLRHGHYWHRAIPPEEFERHPDYFAMINGQRFKPLTDKQNKLCTTNQNLIRAYALKACAFFSQSEANTSYSLSPADGGMGWCECPACTRLDETDKDGNVFKTRRILTFYNEVARLVEARFPDRYLCGYVYGDYMRPPIDSTMSIHPNVQLVLAANYQRRLFIPAEQKRWQELIRGWTRLKPIATYYDFPAWFKHDFGQPMPPNKKILGYMFPILKKNNVKGLYVYGLSSWGHGAAFNYIFSRLAWDARQNIDALYADFFSKCYGRGGKNIQAIYELIEDALGQYCLRNPPRNSFPNDDLLREVYAKKFKKIESLYCQALAAEPVGKAHQRIEMFGDNLVVLYRMLRLKNLFPHAPESRFSLTEADYYDFLQWKRGLLSLAPEVTKTIENKNIVPLSAGIQEHNPFGSEWLHRYRMRGNQHIVALATFTGPAEISLQNVTGDDGLLEFSVYEADGTRITEGATAQDSVIAFNVKAGQQYHLFFYTNNKSFSFIIPDGIHYAIDGSIGMRGLWFAACQNFFPPMRYVPALYFHVPSGIKSFDITLSSHYPRGTAIASVYDPHKKNVATLSTADGPQSNVRIPCAPAQAGIWKITFSPAEKGRFEDVWIKFGRELSGYASIEADKMLTVRAENLQ